MCSRTPKMRWVVLCVALMFVMAASAQAQSGRGTISGLVKDESGAIVPGASVTATNVGTNAVTETTTNADGLYSFQNLQIGTYSVSLTLAGFAPYTQDGIRLELGEAITLDHTLKVGSLADAVTVTADTSLLQTGNAEVGTTMTSEVVTDLPLNISGGRSILNFAYAVTPSVEGEGKDNAWDSHVAGGLRFSNEVVLDGTSAVIQIAGWVGESSPPMEAVEEFKVQTSGIPAEYGRTTSGVFNFSLKSGTNNLHGSAFFGFRNEIFNANTFQNNYLLGTDPENADDYQRPDDRQYLTGFSLGGPIIKDKTFFFVALEYFRSSRYVLGAFNRTVPTEAFLNGDFSALLNTGAAPLGVDNAGNPIYPGAILDPGTGTVFPGNVIPSDRFSSVSRQITDIYRSGYLPMVDRIVNNSAATELNNPEFQQRQLTVKLTHQFSPKSQLNGSFVYSYRPRTLADQGGVWDPNDPDGHGGPLAKARFQGVKSPQVRLNYNHTFGSNVINTTNFSWGQYHNPSRAWAADGGWPSTLGFADLGRGNFPDISFGGAVNGIDTDGIGYGSNAGYTSDVFIVSDSLSWVTGRHMFKFGGEYRYMKTTSWTGDGTYSFDFEPTTTGFPGQPWSNQVGFGFASFLLGEVDSASVETPGDLTGSRNYMALFAQDDFRVNEKLTVNVGLRWETTGPWTEKNGHWAEYDREAINATRGTPGTVVYATDSSTTFEGPRDYTQFGPRIGFTYTPTDKLVFRSAYGIFYQPVGMDYWAGVPYGWAPGYRGTNRVAPAGQGTPVFNWDSGYPGVEIPGATDPNAVAWGPVVISDQSLEGGRLQQWNVGFEYELSRDLVVGVNYLGNKGSNLHNSYHVSNNPTDIQAYGDLLRRGQEWSWVWDEASAANAGVPYPYPGFSGSAFHATTPHPDVSLTWGPFYSAGTPTGETSYHALQLTLNKRLSHGLSGQASYTLSRARGNVTDAFSDSWNWGGNIQRESDVAQEASVIAPFDRTHIFKGYANWELPFGQGRRWMNSGGWKDALFGGWQVSLIFRYESGVPLTILSNAYYPGWYGPIYVNADPNGNFNSQFDPSQFDMSDQSAAGNRYFDPNAFSNPAYGDLGEGPGRFEQLRGFARSYEDLGLMKHFNITDRIRMQLRFEVINLFNRHYFNTPETGIGSSNFGLVTSPAGLPRQGQAHVRIEW